MWIVIMMVAAVVFTIYDAITKWIPAGREVRKAAGMDESREDFRVKACNHAFEEAMSYRFSRDQHMKRRDMLNAFMREFPEWNPDYSITTNPDAAVLIGMALQGKVSEDSLLLGINPIISHYIGREYIAIEPHRARVLTEKFMEKYQRTLREHGLNTTLLVEDRNIDGTVVRYTSLDDMIRIYGYGSEHNSNVYKFAETTVEFRRYAEKKGRVS